MKYLPEEFKSGNSVPVERATITRQRMVEILAESISFKTLITNILCSECEPPPKFKLGDKVRKTKGSQWHGTIVGTYSTTLTPEGYAVESSTEHGSVQIYPAAALKLDTEK